MQLTWATPLYILLLAALVLKSVHVVVVVLWLLRHGSTVAKDAGRLDRSVTTNERAFHDAMVVAGAGKAHGIMFFGIKDLALTDARATARHGNWFKWLMLTAVRFAWHGFGLAAFTVVALFLGAYLPEQLSSLDRLLLFLVGEAMITIMFLVGVEMVVLMITMGRWLPYYHRLLPARLVPDARVRETVSLITTCVGSAIITLTIMAAMLGFASRRTSASPPAISDDILLGILQSFARAIRLLGTAGDGVSSDTVAGALLTVSMLPLILAYIGFVLPIAAAVVDAGRPATRNRAPSAGPGTTPASSSPPP